MRRGPVGNRAGIASKAEKRIVTALLDHYGQTFAEEISIDVATGKPSPLFRLLVASSLLAANVDARLGLRAAKALNAAGYRTAERLAGATDHERWQVLADARYLRKRRTAAQLGALAALCSERYGGDLRRLQHEAGGDVAAERDLLLEFKGVGEVGADIFLREAQVAWVELRPYADARVTGPAKRLGLPASAEGLARLVGPGLEFARLTAALVRCDLADGFDEIRAAGESRNG